MTYSPPTEKLVTVTSNDSKGFYKNSFRFRHQLFLRLNDLRYVPGLDNKEETTGIF